MFYIGVLPEKDALRVAILKKERNSITIVGLHTFSEGPDNVKLFYNLPPFHTGKQIQIISGLESSDIFIRKLHLPLKDKRKILAALPFQLESLIPYSDENAVICPLLQPLSKQMTSVTVMATVKSKILSHISALKNFDIAADVISAAQSALMRFARWQFPSVHQLMIFDVRDQKICAVVIEGKELLLSQTICVARKELISGELEKLAVFLKQKGTIDENISWVLTGDLSLADALTRIFSGPRLQSDQLEMSLFALPIGFALDAFAADHCSVQFCQKELTPSHTLQSRHKKALSYFALCVAAALFMALGSTFTLKKKQKSLALRLQSYLSPALSCGSLSTPREIEEKLLEWDRSLRGRRNTFPFLPTVPRLSDVLAWLSAHPALATEDGGQRDGVDIKSLHYSLSKYPKIGETSTPYVAQMQIEFSSTTPRPARDFHEALLKGDAIVNAKKEIKWQVSNQNYQASFELNKGVLK